MPGIDQLKKFDSDIIPLGGEPDIRKESGTTMPEVGMPDNLPVADDSYDFEFGLPQQEKATEQENDLISEADSAAQSETSFEQDAGSTLPEEPIISSMEDLDPDIAAFLTGTAPSPAPSSKASDFEIVSEQEFSEPESDADFQNESASFALPSVAAEDVHEAVPETSFAETESFRQPEENSSLDSLLAEMEQRNSSVREQPSVSVEQKDGISSQIGAAASVPENFTFDDLDDLPDSTSAAFSGESEDVQAVSDSEHTVDDGFYESDVSSPLSADSGNFPASPEEFNLNDDLSEELNEGFPPNTPDISETDISEAAKDFDLDAGFELSEQTPDFESSVGDENDLRFGSEDDVPASEGINLDSFEIPGFSDTVTAPSAARIYGAEKKKSGGVEEDFDRTYLNDAEYKLFRKNLYSYPLNVRIAVEQLIVKNEFTDAAVMEVLFKVIKKVSARHLASHLEKMLDISISVPLNYERRTAEQYEIYKTSLEYQLKNRIIPGTIAALILGGILYVLSYFGYTFIYRPLKAESLYKTGYHLIAQELYTQSETKFNEALTYGVKKKWFFKYARAYREKRQYRRAALMYEQLIKRFKFDKQGGLEYARMESEDLGDYEKAVEIVRRFILDYHINDKDAMLLLGDIYLDWAASVSDETETAEKFEQARLQYSTLMNLYGSGDLYLSRMLRYFIRTDNLREVLPLKTYFTSGKKVTLSAADLIDLGGYLLEKQYGYLPSSDEYLRGYIDNVKKILEQGIKADPSVPEGHYNLSRYFVRTGNSEQAKLALSNALAMFEAAQKQSHERTLKHIDTYRLLGEQYTVAQEYLLAEQQYADGIRLFEQKVEYTGLKSNKNVGKLYSDMADIDYFISGDIQNAFRNYKHAVEHGYDTPSVRYRIGFVQYTNGNYSEALGSFIKTASEDSSNRNLLLALGNVLSIRGDESAARGYYERLIHILDADRERFGIVFPQVREDHYRLVDLYLKASNNLGVTLSRLAEQTGNTSLQAQAILHFSESVRAWDALTRNQKTMLRLEGSNLAAQNIKYVTYPKRVFEPSIYAAIPAVLYGEVGLKQYTLE